MLHRQLHQGFLEINADQPGVTQRDLTMKTRAWFASCLLLGLSGVALAHTGSGDAHTHAPFWAGLLHPLGGADHLVAMLAVGAWSALAVRPVWAAPLAFVAMLCVGALAALGGLAVPAVEPMIAASLLAIGLLVATQARLPALLAVALTGVFAFFHGAAHGTELTSGAHAWAALLGVVITTAALHATGIGLGQWRLKRHRWLSASAGGAVAALGSVLLLRLAA